MSDKMDSKSTKDRNGVQSAGQCKGGAQAQGATSCHADRLVRLGHDGPGWLVGGGADAARRGTRTLARQALSREPFLDTHAAGHRLGLGCVNAWHWVAKEGREIREQEENNHE